MLPLLGIGVIVTRPDQQSLPLCRLLAAQGAATFRLPAIEIKPRGELRAMAARIGAIEAFDLLVFTSANAVRFGAPLLGGRRDLTLAAIGPATARALTQSGYAVAIQPVDRFDSEALLTHPRLQDLAGQRILLIKGSNGRDVLPRELERRGARVTCLDVYERAAAQFTGTLLDTVHSHLEAGRMQVITATSLDIGARVLHALPATDVGRLHWLVSGDRIASALRNMGLLAPILTAASAEDHDLVTALLNWRSPRSIA